MFDVGYCEFDLTTGGSVLDTVSNIDYEPKQNNLTINYEKFVHSGLFRSITGEKALNPAAFAITEVATTATTQDKKFDITRLKTDLPIIQTVEDSIDNLLDVDNWKRQLGQAVDNLESRVAGIINSEITSLFLGNVHGFDQGDLFALAQSQDFTQTATIIGRGVEGTASLQFKDQSSKDLGNIND
jgi:hypothetical protein